MMDRFAHSYYILIVLGMAKDYFNTKLRIFFMLTCPTYDELFGVMVQVSFMER